MKMKFTVAQIRNIADEVAHALQQKMNYVDKYALRVFAKPFFELAKEPEETRIEIIKSYNHFNDNGVAEVPPLKMEDFRKKYEPILLIKHEVEVGEIKLSWFRLMETEAYYNELFDIIEKQQAAVSAPVAKKKI